MFPKTPSITLYDPLGDLLGAGDGHFTYIFEDAVKVAGHACPTVACSFLLAKTALERLFPGETPQRGDVRITVPGAIDQGVNGPISQILTLLTGAAGDNGFHGLGGQFVRHALLNFMEVQVDRAPFIFERISTQKTVRLVFSAEAFPPAPILSELMHLMLSGHASDEQKAEFKQAWRQRVLSILADEGKQTVKEVA